MIKNVLIFTLLRIYVRGENMITESGVKIIPMIFNVIYNP